MSKKWTPRFLDHWLTNPELNTWLERVPGNEQKAICRVCKQQLRAHHEHLVRHAKTKKHIEAESLNGGHFQKPSFSFPVPTFNTETYQWPDNRSYNIDRSMIHDDAGLQQQQQQSQQSAPDINSFTINNEFHQNERIKTEVFENNIHIVENNRPLVDDDVQNRRNDDNVGVYTFEELFGEQRNMLTAAKQFIEFVNKGPSPFHVVDECKNLLRAQGFKELRERDPWKVEKNQKYFVTRNQSTIIAFAVGGEFKPGNGFTMLGAHTDSPCLKVKPKSGKIRHGYHQVGVQLYGGGIWNTWFDRDLTVAGRVLVKEGDKVRHRLVNVKRPILRIPHLAIHLNRKVNDHFGPNLESELLPIIASTVESASSAPGTSKHSPALLDAICSDMGVEKSQLLDFELCLADTQPASIGGALEEFIFAPRLDNLVNAYCGLLGLIESCAVDGSLNSDPNIRMALLFDNEEVGSTSAQGAQSSLTEWILRRLSTGGSLTAYEEAIPKSFLVSADQVHACHPNYADKHEDNHKVGLHKGPAIKFNANQRYATTAISASILRVIAEKASVPIQDIVVKNDSPCGSTIGPIISAKLGLRTVDMGSPQLSMHSIREMCCTSSISQSIALFKAYYNTFPAVDESFIVE